MMSAAGLFLSFLFLLSSYSSLVSSNSTNELGALLKVAESRGIINKDQTRSLLSLASELNSEPTIRRSEPNPTNNDGDSVFLLMYNQLTLLNVLYFGGSLLIIGSYSLFMTLAFESFNKGGLSFIMIVQTGLFGGVGVYLWDTSYQFLGGLLCSISTGLVPYTVYWIQKYLNLWPKENPGFFQDFRLYVRPGWVVMEIATVIIGLLYLTMIRFPFLLAPVSFSIWFLSMDIAPLLPQWSTTDDLYKLRRLVSLVFGLLLMTGGRVMESLLGSEPDFGFWLYLFGLIAFWFSIVIEHDSNDHLKHSMFILINVTLVVIGSHFQRTTFHVFGTMGLVLMLVKTLTYRGSMVNRSLVLWLMTGLSVVSLLAQGLRLEGSVEIINGLITFVLFNVYSLIFIAQSEGYSLLLLITNLGFIATIPSFSHTLSLWIIDINDPQLIMSLMTLSVLLYHVNVLKYVSIRELNMSSLLFLLYKMTVSVLVSLLLASLGQSWCVWTAGVGIPVVAMILINRSVTLFFAQFIVLLFSICFSLCLSSNLFYLLSCGCMGVVILGALHKGKWFMISGCGYSVILILGSVPLQSKFMTTIGVLYIFGYLSHLAYVVFRRSVLFPLVLVAMGLSIIYAGVVYQSKQNEIYEWSMSLLPSSISVHSPCSSWSGSSYQHLKTAEFSIDHVLSYPHVYLLYTGLLVHRLSTGSLPYVPYACVIGMGLVLVAMGYMKLIFKYCPDLSSSVKVRSMTLSLNETDGIKNGFIVTIKGDKPRSLELPQYLSIGISGEGFWSVMSGQFGGLVINVARSAFLPYKLTKESIVASGFHSGSISFTLSIPIATGTKGLGRSTILNNARKMESVLAVMQCSLLYSTSFYLPYSCLCTHSLAMTDVCQMLLQKEK